MSAALRMIPSPTARPPSGRRGPSASLPASPPRRGVGFGWYPAAKVARLDPIGALRHE